MPGWARTAQLLLESLRTTPPKSYEAAQSVYGRLQEVGKHVDVSEHDDILYALMGSLKESADKGRLPFGPSSPGSSRAQGLGDSPNLPARGGVISAPEDGIEESCAALPHLTYPAYVSNVVSVLEALPALAGMKVRAFGSAVSGFGDEMSDIDVVVAATAASLCLGLDLESTKSRRDLATHALAELIIPLEEGGFHLQENRLCAHIPLLKMSVHLSGRPRDVECDLSMNNLLPVFNTALLKVYADIDSRAVQITQDCRRWAKAQGVHGAPLGHLSSYAFTLLVIFYMQVKGAFPCLQCGAQMKPRIFKEGGKEYNVAMADPASMAWEPAKEATITFSGFVRFFCKEFKWGEWVVSVRTGQCFGKLDYPRLRVIKKGMTQGELGKLIHIEDPFDTERNLNFVLDATRNTKLRDAFNEQHALEKQNKSRQQAQRLTSFELAGVSA